MPKTSPDAIVQTSAAYIAAYTGNLDLAWELLAAGPRPLFERLEARSQKPKFSISQFQYEIRSWMLENSFILPYVREPKWTHEL